MGAAILIGARLLQFSGALILFGAPAFYLYGCDRAADQGLTQSRRAWQWRIVLSAAVVGLVGTLIWVMGETASVSGVPSDAINPAALWTVLWDTRFGRACLARIALLMLSVIASLGIGSRRVLGFTQTILGASVTASFAWSGHGAMGSGASGAAHLVADLLHMLAAGLWIGALLPLAVLVLRAIRSNALDDSRAVKIGLERVSAIGFPMVAVLVFSGLINGGFLIGLSRWRALYTTAYGIALIAKLSLFGVMLGLAALNRYRMTPALGNALDTQRPTQPWLRALGNTVWTETALALLVLLTVSVLGTLVPPISEE